MEWVLVVEEDLHSAGTLSETGRSDVIAVAMSPEEDISQNPCANSHMACAVKKFR